MAMLSLAACMIWKKKKKTLFLDNRSSSKNYSELSGDARENIICYLSWLIVIVKNFQTIIM